MWNSFLSSESYMSAEGDRVRYAEPVTEIWS
jgi:hypothetical protein